MDMDMSMASSTSLPETYADLEVEVFQYGPRNGQDVQSTGETRAVNLSVEQQILEDQGGLDHNEVAELVGFTFDISHQSETSGVDKADFPIQPGNLQIFGVWGANLDVQEMPGALVNTTDATAPVENGVGLGVEAITEPGVFHNFVDSYETPFFNDQEGLTDQDGYGGGGSVGSQSTYKLIYPVDMGVRGPVLDENDDLSLVISSVKEGDTKITIETEIRITAFYNIMEIEGVRNDFDMP